MPTLPPQPGSAAPHEAPEIARSFGVDADRYHRTRPTYPDDLVARIVAASPGRSVVDVGCGTGIATGLLRAAGCQVLGVEVDARMAALTRDAGFEVEVSAFESWDPAGRVFDAVVAAQTWHWVDPVAGAAAAARVLRPGGLIALLWNVFQPPEQIASAFAEVHDRVMPPTAPNVWRGRLLDGYQTMFATAEDGLRTAAAFAQPQRWHAEWSRDYTRDEWLDQLPTHGGMNRLPAELLDRLLTETGAAIDAAGGAFTMAYTTIAVVAHRTADAPGRR